MSHTSVSFSYCIFVYNEMVIICMNYVHEELFMIFGSINKEYKSKQLIPGIKSINSFIYREIFEAETCWPGIDVTLIGGSR